MSVLAVAIDVNLILQVAVLLLTLLIAYLAKKGLIDKDTVNKLQEENKNVTNIAKAATSAIDKLKAVDKGAAGVVTREVVSNLGQDKKPILDLFLKSFNLNKPDGEGDAR